MAQREREREALSPSFSTPNFDVCLCEARICTMSTIGGETMFELNFERDS